MMGLAEPSGVKPVPFHELLWIVIASQTRATGACSSVDQQLIQNWHGQGESDCLIKTKHCDGPNGC